MKTLETEEIYKESLNVKYIKKKDTMHLLSSLLNELFVVLVVCVTFIVHIWVFHIDSALKIVKTNIQLKIYLSYKLG